MHKKRKVAYLQVALFSSAVFAVICLLHLGLFKGAEYGVLKTFYKMRGPLTPSSQIVIAAIDDASLKELGPWPWKRRIFSDLISKLRDSNAAIIAVDASFAEDALSDDRRLLGMLGEQRDMVLGYSFYRDRERIPLDKRAWATGEDSYDILAGQMIASTSMPSANLPSMAGIKVVPKGLRLKGGMLAFTNLLVDDGQPCLAMPLVARYKNLLLPSFGLAMASRFENFTPLVRRDSRGNLNAVAVGRQILSVGSSGKMFLNLTGPRNSYESLSIIDMLSGDLDKKKVEGKIVIIGPTYRGPESGFETPFGKNISAVELWANTVDNILFSKPINNVADSKLVNIIMVFILGLMLGLLMPFFRIVYSVLISIGIGIAVMLDGYLFFSRANILFPVAVPLIAIAAITIIIVLYRLTTEERQRNKMRARFGPSLKEKTLDELARNPKDIPSAGERRHLSVLTVEIRNFPQLFDQLQPEKMTGLMQAYFNTVAASLAEEEAFIVSVGSDRIIAVFGAPVRKADHAMRACRAALGIRRVITKKKSDWKSKYPISTLKIGIGIQTGPLVAGEMGSRGGYGFSLIGPAVRMSERFASLDRLYHTTVIVGSETMRSAKDFCAFRPLDMIRLPAVKHPIEIYELMGNKNVVIPFMEKYKQAYDAYRRRNFELALRLADDVLTKVPYDGPSLLIHARSKRFLETPPAANWDGIWTVQE